MLYKDLCQEEVDDLFQQRGCYYNQWVLLNKRAYRVGNYMVVRNVAPIDPTPLILELRSMEATEYLSGIYQLVRPNLRKS